MEKVISVQTNVFVSFTEVDKLGVYPKSRYSTPLGIYAYPASYIIDAASTNKDMTTLPFAGAREYASIFSAQGNIINLSDITDNNLTEYYRQLIEGYVTLLDKTYSGAGTAEWKKVVDWIENTVIDAASHDAKINTPPGRFWYVAMTLATSINTGAVPVTWNKLFRASGIDGIIDYGLGVIHTSEDFQAVFFSIAAIQNVDRVYNKYSPEQTEKSISIGKINKFFSSASEEEQIDKISDNPLILRHIKNPSEAVQVAAVGEYAEQIHYLINPSEKVQMAAINRNYKAITYIKNQTEKVQLAAIAKNVDSFAYMNNPTEKAQLAAMEKDLGLVNSYKYMLSPAMKKKLKELLDAEKGKK